MSVPVAQTAVLALHARVNELEAAAELLSRDAGFAGEYGDRGANLLIAEAKGIRAALNVLGLNRV